MLPEVMGDREKGWMIIYLIVVVDENNGMMFNHRRQSQDRVLREKILFMTSGKKLWMNAYTYKQFEDCTLTTLIQKDDHFLDKAEKGEYCFVENKKVDSYRDKIEKIILYKWNSRYPGDFFFDIDLRDGSWRLKDTEEFAGASHEKITMEVYERE